MNESDNIKECNHNKKNLKFIIKNDTYIEYKCNKCGNQVFILKDGGKIIAENNIIADKNYLSLLIKK